MHKMTKATAIPANVKRPFISGTAEGVFCAALLMAIRLLM